MKKMKRVVALALAVALCLSLCGCRELDEMKARHATWMENGNILWNDHAYVPLYTTEGSVTYEHADDLNWDDREVIHVTQPDVPVLLSGTLGTNGYTGAGGLLLKVNTYIPPAVSLHDTMGTYSNTVYCRADMYNWTVDALQNGYDIQEYGYYFYSYETGEEKRGSLSNAHRQAIEDALRTAIPTDSYAEEYYNHYEYSLTISAYSTAHLFSQAIGELFCYNGTYYVESSYYDGEDNYIEKFYKIPETYTALFNDLFKNLGLDKGGELVTASTTLGDIL